MIRNSHPRFMGLPINLVWEGWRSNTYELQKAGWEISVSENPMDHSMQIALRNRTMKLFGLSKVFDYNYRMMEVDRHSFLADLVVPIVHVAPQIQIQTISDSFLRGRYGRLNEFKPVDACPSMAAAEMQRLEDLIHFQPIPQTQEIIVPEKSVSDLLQEILKKQIPEQERYRQRVREEALLAKNRQPEELPGEKKVHAQIITLRQVA